MQLTLDLKQDIKKFLAISGFSLALIIGQTGVANAAPADADRDGLTAAQEKIAKTSPTKADTDGDGEEDGDEDDADEDDDCDGEEDEVDEDDDNDGESDGEE